MTRAGSRCSFGRSTTTWKEAVSERPSRWPTCSFVSTNEVSPSVATTTPLAVRSTFPRTRTSTRTLWRSAFCTTLLFSLLAKAGSARSASTAAAMRKVKTPPFGLPFLQQYKWGRRFQNRRHFCRNVRHFLWYAQMVTRKPATAPVIVVVGFFVGLFLASMNHILPAARVEQGVGHW